MKAENFHSEFGKRLRAVRKEKGLSQTAVCKVLKLPTSVLSGYETGQRNPTITRLKILADFYGVTTDWLIGRDRYMYHKSDLIIQEPRTNYFLNDLLEASEEDLQKLQQLWEIINE